MKASSSASDRRSGLFGAGGVGRCSASARRGKDIYVSHVDLFWPALCFMSMSSHVELDSGIDTRAGAALCAILVQGFVPDA